MRSKAHWIIWGHEIKVRREVSVYSWTSGRCVDREVIEHQGAHTYQGRNPLFAQDRNVIGIKRETQFCFSKAILGAYKNRLLTGKTNARNNAALWIGDQFQRPSEVVADQPGDIQADPVTLAVLAAVGKVEDVL